ncbi:MAG TPA: hypothetical protein VFI24_25175 [Pyrinomonadaceae bacterium]|nr:hypothetical protein [Pyrinomonadaceae bacterium]
MHNCKATRELFTELLLDGVDFRTDEALSVELNRCPECRAEFEALAATLRMTGRATEVAAPPNDYWTDYHSKLRQRLLHTQTESTTSRAKAQRHREKLGPLFEPLRPRAGASLFIRFLKTSVPVPLPLAIALVVAAALLVPLAIRAARKSVQPSGSTTFVRVPVEVPVVQEKIVTRVVYRDRRPVVSTTKRRTEASRAESIFAKSRTELPPASLSGFKPPDEIKLTVIKGGVPNEK